MAIRLVSSVLVRAPLLRLSDLERPQAALLQHPLGAAAVALASRDLGAALGARKANQASKAESDALHRYGRRAAFRPTPVGLLAGVTTAVIGDRTRIRTTGATPAVVPSWGRLYALARALLDDPSVRVGVKLRLCPSLLRGTDELCWLQLGEEETTVASAAIDEPLLQLLACLADGAQPWSDVRRALSSIFAGVDDETAASDSDIDRDAHEADVDVDDWLLLLIDQGLLTTDLVPPLVGPAPADAFVSRLRALAADAPDRATGTRLASLQVDFAAAVASARAGDVMNARVRLAALPGTTHGPDLHGVLCLQTAAAATIDRRALERAAALAPLLVGLQAALAAPSAERALDPALRARLSEIAEVFGAGAFDFAALATGGYGARLVETAEPEPPARLGDDRTADLLAYLVEGLTAVAAAGADELVLDADALAALLPPTALPPSFELTLSPARAGQRTQPGAGWLLGHHAPAGASWGRFAHEVPALAAALGELTAIEAARNDDRQMLDVEHAASRSLADLCAHPPIRPAALALTGWPAGAAISPAELELVIDGAAAEPIDLRTRTGTGVTPSPLHRVRSTTLPAGLQRLLAGWSFARQHAPWSFSWGPLAGLEHLPRVVLDGFVLAPRSFRLPAREVLLDAAAFKRWRRELRARGHQRWVQVGQGDELLPVDLDAASAAADLVRHAGGIGHEIWPPLERQIDRGGRRIEVVAAFVDDAGSPAVTAGRVPPPSEAGPADSWLTFRLYGPREQQDAVLFELVAPQVAAARAEGMLAGWFFLPYVDPGTGRDHLRVRFAATDRKARERLARGFARAARQAQEHGRLVTVESADYFPERARYGGPDAQAAAERIFEASSDALVALLHAEHEAGTESDRHEALVRANDALTRGLGLDGAARRALAERRRRAFAARLGEDDEALRLAYRTRQRGLLASLMADTQADRRRQGARAEAQDPLAALFAALRTASARAAKTLAATDRAALERALPALLHVQAVRFLGLDPVGEQLSHVLWARALEGLAASTRGRDEGA